jgi:hypothetical protein
MVSPGENRVDLVAVDELTDCAGQGFAFERLAIDRPESPIRRDQQVADIPVDVVISSPNSRSIRICRAHEIGSGDGVFFFFTLSPSSNSTIHPHRTERR